MTALAILIVAGLIVGLAAWTLPANLTSISPALLREGPHRSCGLT